MVLFATWKFLKAKNKKKSKNKLNPIEEKEEEEAKPVAESENKKQPD